MSRINAWTITAKVVNLHTFRYRPMDALVCHSVSHPSFPVNLHVSISSSINFPSPYNAVAGVTSPECKPPSD